MTLLSFFPKKLYLLQIFFLCILNNIVLSQGSGNNIEDYLGVPDTIVFVSEENIDYSGEYLMIHFHAIDKGSKYPVPANFKIYSKINNKLLSGAPEDKHIYQASLVSNEEYLVEVNAPGYVSYSESLRFKAQKEKKDLHKIIPLEKSNFITTLKAINEATGTVINNAAITLINITSNKTIHTLVNPETGTCRANFDLNSVYKVEVNAIGYRPYYEEYETMEKLASKDFMLSPISSFSIIKIFAVDVATQNPINAKITILDNENNEIPVNRKKDYAEANISSGFSFQIQAEANGYEYFNESIFIEPNLDKTTLELKATASINVYNEFAVVEESESDATFENIEIGKAIVLNNIFFDQSKFTLQEASYKELNKLINTLNKNPQYNIIIAGYTDNQGDKKLNLLLSQNRAKVIANYLIENGIEENRLEVVGYGSQNPIAPNDSEEKRMKNRRVEFTIK